ncbi:MAG TPA: type II toxin-antitoxin system RelE/ParE family toxin [Candidatus Bacteroides merdigallinarum]|uniref:Type II toxin-antitoxin system RelE/ParE family toxin n=1 Tax=Candidatus Bacteroides merdigallinarum TaxID=2838473 RepID=A0A9D2E7T1_9BACE|nr:type II toxin-antitoxin system RelE/ParE family toxin [Candidatus Bacteroides merdigallinarum]
MNYKIEATEKFKKELKRLGKKYRSMKEDYAQLLASLEEYPTQGADLGGGVRKVRMAITSKGKGKSGGARVITLTVLVTATDTDLWLLTIYDKSERESISDQEIQELREQIEE